MSNKVTAVHDQALNVETGDAIDTSGLYQPKGKLGGAGADGQQHQIALMNKTAEEKAQEAEAEKQNPRNFIERLFQKFEDARVSNNEGTGLESFSEHLSAQIEALGTGDSSDPQKLARYQKAVMMFTVHTNAQSSMVKSIADLDKSVVRDFN